ncbi:MAG: hypothetical protein QJR01_08015 [Kyrpidia sp.]|nr:hypothetical protein [Kyrpidia sp.]
MQINLLPQPESSGQSRTVVLTGSAGVLVLVNLWAAVTWIAATADRGAADAVYNQMSARLPQLQQQAAELSRREELIRRIEAFNRWAMNRPIFLDEVHLLSSLLPKNSSLLTVHFVGQADYDVKASMPDLESVATYLRQLQKNPRVASLKVKTVTRQTVTLSAGQSGAGKGPLPAPGSPTTQAASPGGTGSQAASSGSSGRTGMQSSIPGTGPTKPPIEDLQGSGANQGGTGGGGGQGGANTFSAARRAEPTGNTAGGAAPSWWNRLLALLPWGSQEARASDGPMPAEENPDLGGTSPAGSGMSPAPLSGSPSQPGAVPTAPVTAPQGGGGSAPSTKTVYELDFTVTLGR